MLLNCGVGEESLFFNFLDCLVCMCICGKSRPLEKLGGQLHSEPAAVRVSIHSTVEQKLASLYRLPSSSWFQHQLSQDPVPWGRSRAVHDGVASVQREGVLPLGQALLLTSSPESTIQRPACVRTRGPGARLRSAGSSGSRYRSRRGEDTLRARPVSHGLLRAAHTAPCLPG